MILNFTAQRYRGEETWSGTVGDNGLERKRDLKLTLEEMPIRMLFTPRILHDSVRRIWMSGRGRKGATLATGSSTKWSWS